jgi:hypothetical protein
MNDSDTPAAPDGGRDADVLTRGFLTYVLIPAWLVAGLLDWYWHRATKIERTSGTVESVTHVLMAAEAGAGIMLGLFCEIDAGVIATMAGAAILHEATVAWDVAYTKRLRPIHQYEYHTHSFLEALPFVTAAFAAFMYPHQARALVGLSSEPPRLRFRPSRTPPSPATFAALGAGVLLGVVPYFEELVRCLRAKPGAGT